MFSSTVCAFRVRPIDFFQSPRRRLRERRFRGGGGSVAAAEVWRSISTASYAYNNDNIMMVVTCMILLLSYI